MVVDIAAKGFSAFDNFLPDHHADIDLDAHHYQARPRTKIRVVVHEDDYVTLQCFGEANGWSELPDGWSRHLEEACRCPENIKSGLLVG